MPDITMCKGQPGCPLCKNCYRYTARPGYQQSYFAEPPAKKRRTEDYVHIRDYWSCVYYTRT